MSSVENSDKTQDERKTREFEESIGTLLVSMKNNKKSSDDLQGQLSIDRKRLPESYLAHVNISEMKSPFYASFSTPYRSRRRRSSMFSSSKLMSEPLIASPDPSMATKFSPLVRMSMTKLPHENLKLRYDHDFLLTTSPYGQGLFITPKKQQGEVAWGASMDHAYQFPPSLQSHIDDSVSSLDQYRGLKTSYTVPAGDGYVLVKASDHIPGKEKMIVRSGIEATPIHNRETRKRTTNFENNQDSSKKRRISSRAQMQHLPLQRNRTPEDLAHKDPKMGALASTALYQSTSKNDMGCKCSKSRCLKLYCDCFQAGGVCSRSCFCVSCQNTVENSGPTVVRTIAIGSILERRPDAFEARQKQSGGGCSCKKNRYVQLLSSLLIQSICYQVTFNTHITAIVYSIFRRCLKKYCECFNLRIKCQPGVRCRCNSCENIGGDEKPRSLITVEKNSWTSDLQDGSSPPGKKSSDEIHASDESVSHDALVSYRNESDSPSLHSIDTVRAYERSIVDKSTSFDIHSPCKGEEETVMEAV
jgi:hypothetical protein